MPEGITSFLNTLKTFTLEKLLTALVILLVCLVIIHLLNRLLVKILRHPRFDPRIQRYILSGSKILLYILTVLIVADSLGLPVASLLALFSVLGLAISLAVQDVLKNIASGLVLIFSKPFQIGDYIETSLGNGTVAAIDLTYTHLDTVGGQRLLIPNSQVSTSKITNFTQSGKRRMDHTVTASYDDAIPAVKAACMEAVAMTPDILDDPAPEVVVTNYGESAIEYHVRCWSSVATFWPANNALLENIKAAFDRHGITMTYNHLNVHIMEK